MKFILIYLLFINQFYANNDIKMYNDCLINSKINKNQKSTNEVISKVEFNSKKQCELILNKDRKHSVINNIKNKFNKQNTKILSTK
jgi:hypothetical protein